MSRRRDSPWSLVVIVLSLGCSFCVVVVLPGHDILEFVVEVFCRRRVVMVVLRAVVVLRA